jgi:hypothetical protein
LEGEGYFSKIFYLAREIEDDEPGWGDICLSFNSAYCFY